MDEINFEQLGLNAGQVAIICAITDQLKSWIDGTPFSDKIARFYPVLPVLVGIGYEILLSGAEMSGGILKTGIKYGMYAAYLWNLKRVTLEKR